MCTMSPRRLGLLQPSCLRLDMVMVWFCPLNSYLFPSAVVVVLEKYATANQWLLGLYEEEVRLKIMENSQAFWRCISARG